MGRVGNCLGNLALNNSVLRRMPHLKLASGNFRGGDNFKIGDWHEAPDFQLALAHDGQGRRLHAANADDPARPLTQDHGRSAGKGQIVDLVGLPARNSGGVKARIFGVWLCSTECVANGLGILRSEHHPHDLAAVAVMLKNLLTNELAFAVAVGGEPNPLGGAQCLADGF